MWDITWVASGLKEGEITYASCCSCPAGKGPYASCKYTAALCFALEEFVRLQSSRDFQTCTERLQTLNQPRKKKLDPQTVYKIDFSRKVYGRKEESVTKQLNDPRPQAYRENNSHKANESLLNELFKGKPNCGFFFLFSTEKLQPSNNSASNREQNSVLQSVNVTWPIKMHPPSLQDIYCRADKIKKNLFVGEPERKRIKLDTQPEQLQRVVWAKED